MKVQEIDGKIYTQVDEETFVTQTGCFWTLTEREEIIDMIKWAEKELAKIAKRDLTDWDVACLYDETQGILTDMEESLEIANALWDL